MNNEILNTLVYNNGHLTRGACSFKFFSKIVSRCGVQVSEKMKIVNSMDI